jgi:hypothetical protein
MTMPAISYKEYCGITLVLRMRDRGGFVLDGVTDGNDGLHYCLICGSRRRERLFLIVWKEVVMEWRRKGRGEGVLYIFVAASDLHEIELRSC